jgi:hypothetical protein
VSEYEYLHESEEVFFRSPARRPARELWQALLQAGFYLDDDVFILPHAVDRRSRWQSSAAGYVHVFAGDGEIYDEDAEWDSVRLNYHLATLPRNTIPTFVNAAAELAGHLDLPLEFRSETVAPEELHAALNGYADQLAASVGEPGSKDVRILIESTYPR